MIDFVVVILTLILIIFQHQVCKIIVTLFDCYVISSLLGFKAILFLAAEATLWYNASFLNSVAAIWGIMIAGIYTKQNLQHIRVCKDVQIPVPQKYLFYKHVK